MATTPPTTPPLLQSMHRPPKALALDLDEDEADDPTPVATGDSKEAGTEDDNETNDNGEDTEAEEALVRVVGARGFNGTATPKSPSEKLLKTVRAEFSEKSLNVRKSGRSEANSKLGSTSDLMSNIEATMRDEFKVLQTELLEALRVELRGSCQNSMTIATNAESEGFSGYGSATPKRVTAARPPPTTPKSLAAGGSPFPNGHGGSPRSFHISRGRVDRYKKAVAEDRFFGSEDDDSSSHAVSGMGKAKTLVSNVTIHTDHQSHPLAPTDLSDEEPAKDVSSCRSRARGVSSQSGGSTGPSPRRAVQFARSSAALGKSWKAKTKANLHLDSEDPGHSNEKQNDQLLGLKHRLLKRLERIVRHTSFELVSMLMILGSAVHIGFQTENMADTLQSEPAPVYRAFDIFFLIFFTGELAIRLLVHRRRFFTMPGVWTWNVLDFVLIIGQIIDETAQAFFVSSRSSGVSASLVRLIRLLRALRVVRVMHAFHLIEELRFLVVCVQHSCQSFHWAAALIAVMVYVFSVYCTQLATQAQIDSGPIDELDKYFGSVPRSSLSLFEALTGGVDWDTLVTPLMNHISPWMGVVFVIYISLAFLAVMNVITGIFVQKAMEGAVQIDTNKKVRDTIELFQRLTSGEKGKGRSAYIEKQKVLDNLEEEDFKKFFEKIDLNESGVSCLFEMLDPEGEGRVDLDHFLGGCMRLQEPAKAIDVILAMRAARPAAAEYE